MDTTVSSVYNTEDTQHSNFHIKDDEEKKKRRLEDELAAFSILTGIQQPDSSSSVAGHSLFPNTPTKSKPDSIYITTPPDIDGTNTKKSSTKMAAYDENPELDDDHDESEVSVQSGSTIWKVLTGVSFKK